MEEQKKYSIDQAHQYFAIECNNAVFGLAEIKKMTNEEKERIIQTAHSSLLHWQKFSKSTIANSQRGYYMIAKAYVKVGEKENALKYANLCFQITEENPTELLDFDFAYAYEMKARTAAMNDNKKEFEKFYAMAESQEKNIKQAGDLKYFSQDFHGGEWFGFK